MKKDSDGSSAGRTGLRHGAIFRWIYVPSFAGSSEAGRDGTGLLGLGRAHSGLCRVHISIMKNLSTRVMGPMSTSPGNLLLPVLNTLNLNVHGRRMLL